jgi:hypothetical protein
MKKWCCIISLFYFVTGAVILPSGDFSMLPQLPEMYAHCKANEDKDMNVLDFITDHLLNWDMVFDQHTQDEQKPHQQNFHPTLTVFLFATYFPEVDFDIAKAFQSQKITFVNKSYGLETDKRLFRPPIA